MKQLFLDDIAVNLIPELIKSSAFSLLLVFLLEDFNDDVKLAPALVITQCMWIPILIISALFGIIFTFI